MNINPTWWQTFFDGLAVEFWLRMVPDSVSRDEAAFIERTLGVQPGDAILDIPCGGGRHAVALAARGYRLTGIDISADFLKAARKLADDQSQDAAWIQQPMHEVTGSFAGAYCFGNSFGYYDDSGNLAVLRAIHDALRPGARFVMDTSNIAECIFPTYQERSWMPVGDILFLHDRTYDPISARIETRYTFIRETQTQRRTAWQRVYACRELLGMFEQVGFRVLETFSATTGEPFKLGSRRLLVVASSC